MFFNKSFSEGGGFGGFFAVDEVTGVFDEVEFADLVGFGKMFVASFGACE